MVRAQLTLCTVSWLALGSDAFLRSYIRTFNRQLFTGALLLLALPPLLLPQDLMLFPDTELIR